MSDVYAQVATAEVHRLAAEVRDLKRDVALLSEADAASDALIGELRQQIDELKAELSDAKAMLASARRANRALYDLAEAWERLAAREQEDSQKHFRFMRIASVYGYCADEMRKAIGEDV